MDDAQTKAKAIEELVVRIERALSQTATVTGDIRLPDRITGKQRQVDVLVQMRDGYRTLKIMYEVKCHARPVDVAIVEELRGKRDDVDVNKAVLVSTSGFTEAAREKASFYGIELMKLDSALEKPFSWIRPGVTRFGIVRSNVSGWNLRLQEEGIDGRTLRRAELAGLDIDEVMVIRPNGTEVRVIDLMRAEIQAMANKHEPVSGKDQIYEIEVVKTTPGHFVRSKKHRLRLPITHIKAELRLEYKHSETPVNLDFKTYGPILTNPLAEVLQADFQVDGEPYSLEIIAEKQADGSARLSLTLPKDVSAASLEHKPASDQAEQ